MRATITAIALTVAAASLLAQNPRPSEVPSGPVTREGWWVRVNPANEADNISWRFGAARNRLEDAVPRQKATGAVSYAQGPVSALVRANFYGSVRYKPDLPENDETFGAKTLFDAEVGYQLTEALRLSIGAVNVFNTFPDQNTKAANLSSDRFIYNRNVSQFGWNGGFYYMNARVVLF